MIRENTRRVLLPVETTILMVWYLVDGSGTDWSDSSREVPTELCTHGLESVEARILVYKKNTSRWSRLTKAIVNVARPKAVVNAVNKGNNVNSVKPQSFVLLGLETKGLKFPTMDLLDKRLIDKWHAQRLMTGKCPIFTDYEEIFSKVSHLILIDVVPSWLFDIDALTKSMNYKPVVEGNQSNGNAGTKACDDACKARTEIVSGKDYILLRLWTTNLPFSQSLKSSLDAGFKPSGDDEKNVTEEPGKRWCVYKMNKDACFGKNLFYSDDVCKMLVAEVEGTILMQWKMVKKWHVHVDRINDWVSLLYLTSSVLKSIFDSVGLCLIPCRSIAYIDSVYARVSLDKKSTIGGCQFLGSRLISWQCKKQTVVANSIIEVEYVAASSCCGQVLWISYQFLDFIVILNTAGIINIVKIVRKRIERVGENKNRKRDVWNKNRQRVLVSKRIKRNVNVARHNLLLLLKVNAARHNLLLLLKVNVARHNLQLLVNVNVVEGMDCLPNATIFEELTRMRYEKLSQKLTFYKAFFSPQWKFFIHTILQCLSAKTTAWNEFSSTMASAIICLATNQKFNFLKYVVESLVKNLNNDNKFLMYPRFVQVFLDKQVGDMSTNDQIYPSHTNKVFRNMKRVGKGFSKVVTPLFPTMMVQAYEEMGEGSANPINPHHTPTITQPSTSQPQKKQKPRKPNKRTINWVLDLEHKMTTQALEIESLKRRVKRLKKKKRSRTHRLKRLYKVGMSAKIISFKDEGLGEEDASKQGRIKAIDADEDIYLVNVPRDEDMFGVNNLEGDEVVVESDVAAKKKDD
ncbi:putative ribonuclease H-like domain-containing protein [Tanacetum coccineum]